MTSAGHAQTPARLPGDVQQIIKHMPGNIRRTTNASQAIHDKIEGRLLRDQTEQKSAISLHRAEPESSGVGKAQSLLCAANRKKAGFKNTASTAATESSPHRARITTKLKRAYDGVLVRSAELRVLAPEFEGRRVSGGLACCVNFLRSETTFRFFFCKKLVSTGPVHKWIGRSRHK